jgi:hypothetical protein
VFSLDITSRIWDSYFYWGDCFLISSALAVLKLQEVALVKASYENLLVLLKNPSKAVTEDELFKWIPEVKVKPDKYKALLAAQQ